MMERVSSVFNFSTLGCEATMGFTNSLKNGFVIWKTSPEWEKWKFLFRWSSRFKQQQPPNKQTPKAMELFNLHLLKNMSLLLLNSDHLQCKPSELQLTLVWWSISMCQQKESVFTSWIMHAAETTGHKLLQRQILLSTLHWGESES